MHKRVSNRDAATHVRNREEFETHTGSLYGIYSAGYYPPTGILPREHREALGRAWERAGTNLFTVYSYATPIAWHDGEQWTRPDVKYSHTTSRHQGLTPRDGTKG